MKQKKTCFTLMELLVALGIFSIMLVFMLQFFSGAQKLTSAMDKKSQIYANVRSALDVMSTLLQNTLASCDQADTNARTPFLVVPASGSNGLQIYFPTKSPYRLAGKSNIVYVGLFGPTVGSSSAFPGELRMAFLTDDPSQSTATTGYDFCFPPFADNGTVAKTEIKNIYGNYATVANSHANAKFRTVLLKNVVDFSVRVFKLDKSVGQMCYVSDLSSRESTPYLLELTVSVMDPIDFERYQNLTGTAKTEFQKQNQYSFSRVVFLNGQQ